MAGVGASSLAGKSKVGARKSMADEERAITVALRLRKKRNKELSFEVNDVESEKVIKVLQEMFDEASYQDRH